MNWYTMFLVLLAFLLARWSVKEPLVAAPTSVKGPVLTLPKRYGQAVEGDLVVSNPLPPT
ncbi:hypothetical protein EBT31_05355 [bacterium]|nr:hypothetical protein [bacterium]